MTMTATASENLPVHVFSTADRCDACGAQAFVRAVMTTGDLLFCGHHGRQYGGGLALVALAVEDGTSSINPKSAPTDL